MDWKNNSSMLGIISLKKKKNLICAIKDEELECMECVVLVGFLVVFVGFFFPSQCFDIVL